MLARPVCLAAAGEGLVTLAGQRHSPPIGAVGFYLMFLAVAYLVSHLLLRVQLSPAGVRIRALRHGRRLSWPEISAVTIQPQHRGGRRVTLWTVAGEAVRLPLPVTNKAWNEAAFMRGYHQIGQYWLATRSPDQQPLPAHWPGH